MGFGNKLKEVLKKKGITIKELSRLSGISLNTLYSITKRDTQVPDKDIIKKIAEALNINESELYTFEILDAGIRKLLDEQKQNEENARRMLYELCPMLGIEALYELGNNALELLRDEDYWSLFYDHNKIRLFLGDNIKNNSDSDNQGTNSPPV